MAVETPTDSGVGYPPLACDPSALGGDSPPLACDPSALSTRRRAASIDLSKRWPGALRTRSSARRACGAGGGRPPDRCLPARWPGAPTAWVETLRPSPRAVATATSFLLGIDMDEPPPFGCHPMPLWHRRAPAANSAARL